MRRLAVAAVLLLAACGSRVDTAVHATPPVSGGSGRTVTFPDLQIFVGTSNGDVYAQLRGGQPAGPKVHVCDGFVVRIEIRGGANALVSCIVGSTFAVFTYDHRTGTVARVPGVDGPAIWTDGPIPGQSILFVTRGGCAPGATDCAQKLVRRDMRTGATTVIDERVGVVTDFQFTDEGPTVWRAKVTATVTRPESEAGTYLLRDTTLTRFSRHRLVAGFKGRWLLESEETLSFNSGCCSYVVHRFQDETRLTPADVPNERAVAMLSDGRMLAFRPDGDGPAGAMVVYPNAGGRPERSDRGAFVTFRILALEQLGWVIGFDYAGTVPLTLYAYRLGDGAFAVAKQVDATALAVIPPK